MFFVNYFVSIILCIILCIVYWQGSSDMNTWAWRTSKTTGNTDMQHIGSLFCGSMESGSPGCHPQLLRVAQMTIQASSLACCETFLAQALLLLVMFVILSKLE